MSTDVPIRAQPQERNCLIGKLRQLALSVLRTRGGTELTAHGMIKLCTVVVLTCGAAMAESPAAPGSVPRTLRTAPEIEALENYSLLTLTRIYFSTGHAGLSRAERASLGQVFKHLGEPGESVIELRGYADGAASTAADVALSLERARQVGRFLIAHGVAKQRILILGLGAIDPAGPPLRREHQRVDMRVFVPRASAAEAPRESASQLFIENTWGGK